MPKRHLTDVHEIHAILERSEVGLLAMTTPDGSPYAVPVNFVFAEGRVFIHGAPGGFKMDCMAANPRVSFTAFSALGYRRGAAACEFGVSYESAMVFGRAFAVTDSGRKRSSLEAITRKYARGADYAPVSDEACAHTAVIEIVPERITGKVNEPGVNAKKQTAPDPGVQN